MAKGDTPYATLHQRTKIERKEGNDLHGYAIEDILVKGSNRDEIRFAYFKNGNFARIPLDLPESDFLELFKNPVDENTRAGRRKEGAESC